MDISTMTTHHHPRTCTYMKILSRFVVQGNAAKVHEKLTELEELTSPDPLPWTDLINYPSKESLAVLAARFGQLGIFKVLCLKGAPKMYFEIGNLDGKRPLHEAIEHSNMDCVEYLVDQVGVGVNSLKRADWTPLMLACAKADPEAVRYLLRKNADVHFCNKDGWNAFHLACREGNVEVVRMLFATEDHGGSSTVSNNGRSPLHTAALHGRSSVVRFLLEECGYSPSTADASGHTPTMDAKLAGHYEVAQLLESR